MNEHGKFGLSSYYNHYSNWQSALADAGLTIGRSSVIAKDEDATAELDSTSELVAQLLDDIEKSFDE